jgi:magnesium transporter
MPLNTGYADKAGLAPGQAVFSGEQKVDEPIITIMQYNAGNATTIERFDPSHLDGLMDEHHVTWIDICGLHDTEMIVDICKQFNIHALVQEDIVHTAQRPKMDDFDEHIFLVLRDISLSESQEEIDNEQISIVLGAGFVLSFRERPSHRFDPLLSRINSKKFRIRRQKADYLAYALMDMIVDNYFALLETLGEQIDTLQEALLTDPQSQMLQQIHSFRTQMITLRRAVWPLRETIGKFERSESELIEDSTLPYVRDLYDHTIQVMDVIENYRDILSGMLDTFLSSLSNRMNEVMKTLTVIATIFIPPTFFAGVYGMNFEWLPELHWKWGYPAFWTIMIFITLYQIRFFKKKGWF